jgi:hypothetical protein
MVKAPAATGIVGSVGERIGRRVGQTHRVIQLTVRPTGIGGDRRAAKLQQQAMVELEP